MSNLIRVPCPLCKTNGNFPQVRNSRIDRHIHKYGDLYAGLTKSEWRVCSTCGFLHQNPRPSLENLNQFYRTSKYHTEIPQGWNVPANYLEFAHWYYDEKIEYALKHSQLRGGNMFDIGAGHGGVVKVFELRGWSTFGVEPDDALLAFAMNTVGVRSLQSGILDETIELPAKMDLVFSNHTFEHIADLHQAMLGIKKILKPGGFVFTAVPTHYRNRSRLSLEWMNSAHYSMFTHRSLNHLFSYYGLEEVAHTYRGWGKEVDDLWHVAKYTGEVLEPSQFFENPRGVRLYVNAMNPCNSLVHSTIRPIKNAVNSPLMRHVKLMFCSPKLFLSKAMARHAGNRA